MNKHVLPIWMVIFTASICRGIQLGSEVTAWDGANNAKLGGYSQTTTPTPTPQLQVIYPVVIPTASPTPKPIKSWIGFVSHYSENGCLGCSDSLTMANGERLDDTKMTIAFNHLPMNTEVVVTNLDNGKMERARVTDTGGFEKYGRIADLSLALANSLETKTDASRIKIEVVK